MSNRLKTSLGHLAAYELVYGLERPVEREQLLVRALMQMFGCEVRNRGGPR
jgi:hypothetical protein